jgi:hypothetical protein
MSNTFQFYFDELPLMIENGFEGCLVSGNAEISYSREGEWCVESISFDSRRKIKHSLDAYMEAAKAGVFLKSYEDKTVELDRGTPLHSIIYDRLENEWRDHVNEAIQEQLASDREDAAEQRAEMRRDALMGY